MRLQVVTGPPFRVHCIRCKTAVLAGDGPVGGTHPPVYADLDGEPFRAYYCATCAQEVAA